jgi:hypothetical protein
MKKRFAVVLLLACTVFARGVEARSQSQGSQSNYAEIPSQAAHLKPANLKVLPKDISEEELDKVMHGYQQALGVPCGYCHEENPETKQIDYASDENPIKQTARFMITMTSDINNKYLSQLGDRRYAEPITCGNCHRGQVEPPSFDPKAQR